MYEIYNDIIHIRRKVFTEIARIAYEDKNPREAIGKAISDIIPGEVANYRDSVFKERAIVGERLRLTLGLPVRTASELGFLAQGVDDSDVAERFYEAPLVNVITFACEACPTKQLDVTSNCRRCIAHPCINVCPVNAITMGKNQTHIDQDKCIKCGRCRDACPYNAIIQYDRPCAQACGVNAIGSDHLGRAKINQDLCVSCGQCIQKCPFGAIADKSEIYQLIKSMKTGKRHLAIVAPSFISQFGPVVTPEQIFEGIRLLGFDDVMEVALGADIEAIKEAKEYLHEVPEHKPYMGTSCCPSWSMMVKKMFPEEDKNISSSATPMIATGKLIKRKDLDAKVTFIGPCISKKLEALEEDVKDYVDFVITYEELMGMFIAKKIELSGLEASEDIEDSSNFGRGFAASGGVAGAVAAVVAELEPGRTVLTEKANGLHECVKLMKQAKAGKKDGYLLEGMACPGGCLGGPGTLAPMVKAQRALAAFMEKAQAKTPMDNPKIKRG